MPISEWKFRVKGCFIRLPAGTPITACEAIIESGERRDSSPFRLEGVGPGARAQSDGTFQSFFVTQGSALPIAAPNFVSVFVRVAPGDWKPYAAKVVSATPLSNTEILLDLGTIEIAEHELLYVDEN
jgi:hypothetical protein